MSRLRSRAFTLLLLASAFHAGGAQDSTASAQDRARRQPDRTYSVTVIDSARLHAVPSPTPIAALAAKVAGGHVVTRSNEPGAVGSASLFLRGAMASGTGEPVVVIDGIVMRIALSDIVTDDVERIEILKGAAAGAAYGMEGANGAILIFTKRAPRPSVTVRSDIGMNTLPKRIPLSRHHFYQLDANGNFVLDSTGRYRLIDPDFLQDNPYPATYDMRAAVVEQRPVVRNFASVAQRFVRTDLYASLGNDYDAGVLALADGFARRHARLTVDQAIGSKLRLSGGAFYTSMSGANPSLDSTFGLLRNVEPNVRPDSADFTNPYTFLQEQDRFSSWRHRGSWNAAVSWLPLSWLSLEGRVARDRARERYEIRDVGFFSTTRGAGRDAATELSATARRAWPRGVLTSTRLALIDESHAVSQDSIQATGPVNFPESFRRTRLESVVLSNQATIGQRLTVDALVRRDEPSGPQLRSRALLYHRLSGAYRIGDAQVRLAMGTSAPRLPFELAGLEAFFCGEVGVNCFFSLRMPFAREVEAGVQSTFLNRFTAEYTFSRARTKNVPFKLPDLFAPPREYWHTEGTVDAYSHELNLGATLWSSSLAGTAGAAGAGGESGAEGSIDWRVNLTAHRMRARVKDAQYFDIYYLGPSIGEPVFKIGPGVTLGEMYGAQWVRTEAQLIETIRARGLPNTVADFVRNEEGYYVLASQFHTALEAPIPASQCVAVGANPCGAAISRPRIGDANPIVELGLGNSLRWKSFSLYAAATAVVGGNIYNQTRQDLAFGLRDPAYDQSGKPVATRKPFIYYSTFFRGSVANDVLIEDGSYFKLSELAVDWRLPMRRPIRVGLTARNLFTLSRYGGYDPDAAQGKTRMFGYRVDATGYPSYRTVGVRVQFGDSN